MSGVVCHAVVFTTSLVGFGLLMLAMKRHQGDWLGRRLSTVQSGLMRAGGLALLAVAFGCATAGLETGYGAVVWFGWLSVSAGLMAALNTYHKQVMRLFRQTLYSLQIRK